MSDTPTASEMGKKSAQKRLEKHGEDGMKKIMSELGKKRAAQKWPSYNGKPWRDLTAEEKIKAIEDRDKRV